MELKPEIDPEVAGSVYRDEVRGRIDRTAYEPAYSQLVHILKSQIASGRFRPGAQLPSEAQLCQLYQVSPMTVRRAVNILLDQGLVTMLQLCSQNLRDITGQKDAAQPNPNVPWRAILAEQRKGDLATFHYGDNLARAIQLGGKMLVDLIPKIYDTQRALRIIDEDGTDKQVVVNAKAGPGAPAVNDLVAGHLKAMFLTAVVGMPHVKSGALRALAIAAPQRFELQPDAEYAPYAFISGTLFSADIDRVYRSLDMPVWLAYGTRGAFSDVSNTAKLAGRRNWVVQAFLTGGLPFFERPDEFVNAYDAFRRRVA